LEDIIKVKIFLTDICLFNTFNEIYKTYFLNQKPARSLVEVLKLALGAKIEIETIAYKTK
jgi:2-iminobutanoate/2-iminopropanoate deaminase